jgi:hypothetical protein
MALLSWLWLASPFALIGLIAHDRELLAVVSAHHARCRAIGWAGAAIMFLGVAVVPGPLGSFMFLVGTPASGLIAWCPRDDGDNRDGGSPSDVPPIDWGEFERSFWAHVRRRGRRSPRPRAPT